MGLWGRRIWAGVDALLLVYLLVQYDWSLPLGWTGVSLLLPFEALLGLAKVVGVAGALGLAGFAIAREFRQEPDRAPFPFPQAARPLFLTAVLTAAALWILVWTGITSPELASGPADLFGFLTAACRRPAERALYGLLGLSAFESGSAGSLLALLLAVAYLAEKYLRLARRAGRPRGALTLVPVVPVLLLLLAVGAGLRGEQAKRAWVQAQQWAVLPAPMAFPEAVSTCERQGPGWRIPNETELARYLGAGPIEWRDLPGKAWTNLLTEAGGSAVVVGLAPLVRGASPYRCGEETFDPSWLVPDAFSRVRGWACRWLGSPIRHHPSRAPLAVIRAAVVEPVRLPAVCIRAEAEALPVPRRPPPPEVAITSGRQFAELLQQRCADANRPAVACAAFAAADSSAPVGPGVGAPFLAIEQQVDAAEIVFEGMIAQIEQKSGRPRAQVMVRRYLKGGGPMIVEIDGLPPEAAGLTPRDRRLFFAAGPAGDGVLHAAPEGAMAEITPDSIAALGRKLGPGALPPFLAGPPLRGPRTGP
jgi:hypothetical protein